MNYKKNIKILTDFEKVLGNDQPVNFQIENSDDELKKVSKEEFARWMEEGKNIKTPPKERLIYGASGDIDGITYFIERKSKDGVIKESYYRSRSEEEKKQIIERNRKAREQEKSQRENSSNPDKKDQPTEQNFSKKTDKQEEIKEKERNIATNQQNSLQNKETNNQNIYYGVGLVSLVLLLISMAVVRMKKKK